ncbi:MAG: branched-chain amino acid aminotransferase [Alphaproteobacteria bacterium]
MTRPTAETAQLLPYDDRDGVIWFDGALVPWREAKVHVLTHGLHYASCVFEGLRIYGGRPFKLPEHSERLAFSAKCLGFELPYGTAQVIEVIREVIAAQGISEGYVRPMAWRGSEMMAISAQQTRIHVAVAAWEWGSYFTDEGRLRGIRLAISDWRRPSPDCAPVMSKCAGLYMICTLSKHKAETEGYDDALMLDYRGQVAEATGANIFFAKEGKLHTPMPDCFLDGITRQTVIGLARARGIEVIERAILPEEIGEADEVFLTGTAAEVTPVREIDGHNFQVGAITRGLLEDYDKLVREG